MGHNWRSLNWQFNALLCLMCASQTTCERAFFNFSPNFNSTTRRRRRRRPSLDDLQEEKSREESFSCRGARILACCSQITQTTRRRRPIGKFDLLVNFSPLARFYCCARPRGARSSGRSLWGRSLCARAPAARPPGRSTRQQIGATKTRGAPLIGLGADFRPAISRHSEPMNGAASSALARNQLVGYWNLRPPSRDTCGRPAAGGSLAR